MEYEDNLSLRLYFIQAKNYNELIENINIIKKRIIEKRIDITEKINNDTLLAYISSKNSSFYSPINNDLFPFCFRYISSQYPINNWIFGYQNTIIGNINGDPIQTSSIKEFHWDYKLRSPSTIYTLTKNNTKYYLGIPIQNYDKKDELINLLKSISYIKRYMYNYCILDILYEIIPYIYNKIKIIIH
jgi:hypothetical protein